MGDHPQEKPSREAKHMAIYHATSRLRDVREHLDTLFRDCGGSDDPPDKTSQVEHEPTLANTLEHGGARIVGLCDDISRRVDELRELVL